jgi:PBSX family phage terminase large subunit
MIQIQGNKAKVFWTKKQLEFINDIKTRKYQFMLFGGALGSGKSQLMARVFISLLDSHPNTRCFVFRKNLSVLKRTTYQTFRQVAEEFGTPHQENRAEMMWTFPNGSQLWFQELDGSKDNDWNKVKGVEATWIGIDEANEIEEGAFNVLMGRMWRCNPNGENSFMILTCNPAQNWVKTRFYDDWVNNRLKEPFYFKQALTFDNPFLPPEYMETLELLPEAEYQRYVKGNWDFADDPNQLIKYEWIKGNIWTPEGEPDTLGIDVAREGDDRTVFAYSSKEGLHSLEIFRHQDTMTTAQLALERMKEKRIGYRNTGVDVVGVGGGVVDAMREQGYFITDFNSGKAPTKMMGHLLFKNLRAETYWDLREALQKGEYKLPDSKELIQELLSIHYKVTDKIIQIESKAEMKKRMGHSPDLADAVVISKYCSKGKPEILVGMF